MPRILILCTHNSARSQMAEGMARHFAARYGLEAEVHSAGTEKTRVKPEATAVMAEIGISLEGHTSKTLFDLPDPWSFDYVITVCDSAAENCPNYPARTHRLHYPFTDPSGGDLERWRAVRDRMLPQFEAFVRALVQGTPVPPSYDTVPLP
ncbi:arsenate reductase [Deinobacterium chartae]|uniref:Arsenate reductase n=1 Tax=Deinobacterium chartae TaxID=521158 RepID=A0A841HVG0_9DEIO|nr:arsenate reductase ArsC [Deinobacterium chartae]MBB6097367.1 arsenate reductase [Deinobacterium chartae]